MRGESVGKKIKREGGIVGLVRSGRSIEGLGMGFGEVNWYETLTQCLQDQRWLAGGIIRFNRPLTPRSDGDPSRARTFWHC